jgi:hypothetical protein
LLWIVDHQDDTAAMDKVNRTAFPFTTSFGSYKRDEADR